MAAFQADKELKKIKSEVSSSEKIYKEIQQDRKNHFSFYQQEFLEDEIFFFKQSSLYLDFSQD